MIAANDFLKRTEEIQTLIAGDVMDQAMGRLMDFVRDFSKGTDNLNEVIVIKSNYTRLAKAEDEKRLSFGDAMRERNRLMYQSLALMDSIKSSVVQSIAA